MNLDGWIITNVRNREKYREILLIDFITCKILNYKSLRTKIFEEGCYDVTQRETYMGVNANVMG